MKYANAAHMRHFTPGSHSLRDMHILNLYMPGLERNKLHYGLFHVSSKMLSVKSRLT